MSLERDGGRQRKRWRATKRSVERNEAKGREPRRKAMEQSGIELMEQVKEIPRWTAMEQAIESVTEDSKGNCCSSMAQGRLIVSQTGWFIRAAIFLFVCFSSKKGMKDCVYVDFLLQK
ncbi:hypothetical protein Bca4012_062461 [Brassica carinata]|uniref:Uncharacterized protein n=1 Tax=Brassica carinata TaxID=52824 RepID=A0A8X7SGP9_BRACI|nr:hypothetical protein Bca52824_032350 [Brassica carinata]